jgi:hypothetical protein
MFLLDNPSGYGQSGKRYLVDVAFLDNLVQKSLDEFGIIDKESF